jgi:hypothetical protein
MSLNLILFKLNLIEFKFNFKYKKNSYKYLPMGTISAAPLQLTSS